MKFTKKLVTVAAALCAVGALFLTGCRETVDEFGIIELTGSDGATIEFTNDDTVNVNYARAFTTTRTKHLTADITLDIDMSVTSSLTSSGSKAYTAGYIFNLDGSGSEEDPYSFIIVGLRYMTTGLEYYASYFTNVLEKDVSSDKGNFVTADNKAVEYDISKGWKPVNKYAKREASGNVTGVSVCIGLDAYKDGTKITGATGGDPDTFKVSFSVPTEDLKRGADAEEAVTINLDSLNNSKIVYKNETITGAALDNYKFEEFPVGEAKLGYYAMVKKDTTLKCTMSMSNTVRNASTGDAIIWNETITNVR